ncbi:MAG: ZIP family metal transporter [Chloroflexi bacterium]|nr:ZIP family metal transporter [Chloroflexota bacterium]
MLESFAALAVPLQALLAGLFTAAMTAIGSAPVFFTRQVHPRLMAVMLGSAAGIMLAASYWSLLAPAIRITGGNWMQPAIGFLLGGGVLLLIDAILPHIHPALRDCPSEGVPTNWRRSVLLVLAVMLHNIPEGLTIGVAFGAAASGIPEASLTGALVLALGIGLQNLPEGLAVAMPLRCEGLSPLKSFLLGILSGIVEPLAALAGALLSLSMDSAMPYALSFAAGAMIYVVFEELIPEAVAGSDGHYATISSMVGFTLMMVLEVALG